MEPEDPLPRHTTRSALLRTLHKKKCHAHKSFDLDGDGVVSVTDYKLAKDMDTDGSGHIDDDETKLGRTRLARDFFELKNAVTSRFHRRSWEDMEKSASDLVATDNFGQRLSHLRQGLWIRQGRSGRRVVDSLSIDGASLPSARFGLGTTQLRRSHSIAELKRYRRARFLEEANASCRPDSFFFQPVVRYGRQSLLTDMRQANHESLNGENLRAFGENRNRAPQTGRSNNGGANTSRRHLFGAVK